MLCLLSSIVAEATNGGLRCFVGINVKVNGPEGPVGRQQLERKSAALWIAAAVL